MVVLPRPPAILASRSEDLDLAGRLALRSGSDALGARSEARVTSAGALAYLVGSAEGRRFLALPAPRALARGTPEAACPAIGVAGGPEFTDRAAAAQRALGACIASLDPAVAQDCGCRLIALDDAVMVPRTDLAYATGTPARLYAPTLGLDALLVAEDPAPRRAPSGDTSPADADGPASYTTLLRDLTGPVADILHAEAIGGPVTIRFRGGAVFTGQSIPVGFRRGRIAERIYATDPQGRRLVILLGFSPAELAASAGAWRAWPPDL
jgi:hypothetical protein